MKNLIQKICQIFSLGLSTLLIAGCSGGGGGPLAFLGEAFSSFAGSSGGSGAGSGAGGSISGGSALATVHQPEPSSILLLTSGLIGMAIYAKARLKSKHKK